MIVTRAMAEAAMLRRAAMTLLLVILTTATAWAQVPADETKWTIEKFNNGADCYITGYTGATDVTELTIPSTINGANVKKFKDFSLEGFTNLVTLNFDMWAPIEEMPSLRGCTKFKNVNLYHTYEETTVKYPNALPVNIKVIPANAFRNTAIEDLQIEYHGTMTIGDYAFSNLINHTPCTIIYGGPASDWDYHKFEGSMCLQVRVLSEQATEEPWYCGWYGGNLDDNKIYWTRDKNLRMTITSGNWDTFPTKQVLDMPFLHEGTTVKSLYIEHVYAIEDKAFTMFRDLETVEIASGLTAIGKEAFKKCPITSVTLPITLERIGDLAFPSGRKLTDVYFDGTKAQWDAVTKGTDWNYGKTSNYQEHWRCTLTFDMQGHGTAPAPQTVYTNTALTPPEEPTAQGYTFVGWYRFPTAAQPCNFAGGISENTTLYARWTANTNTITFDLNNQDGHGAPIDEQTLTTGNVVSVPAMQYYKDGDGKVYGIEGWYTDAACTEAYDFTTVVDHSFTLYAKWAEATGNANATVNDYTGGTVTLTDELGREVQFGKIFPGRYTLTVTPASGYSFEAKYRLTNRSTSISDMLYTFKGNAKTTQTLDLTAKDADITVTFSSNPIVTYSATNDGHYTEGTFTLTDYRGNEIASGSSVTVPTGGVSSDTDNLLLTINVSDGNACHATITNGSRTYTFIRTIDNNGSPSQITPEGNIIISLFFYNTSEGMIELADNGDNSAVLTAADGEKRMVTLKDRTLYRDGDWNTICLPFDFDLTGSSLWYSGNVTLMELDTEKAYSGHVTGYDEGTLYLNFKDAGKTIKAGKPYIIKWKKPSNYDSSKDITDPVFGAVTIDGSSPKSVTSNDGKVSFCGLYDYVEYMTENRSILFLGKDNTLYFPQPSNEQNPSIGACRSYFTLSDITAGDVPAAGARAFVLNFGDDLGSETGIADIEHGTWNIEHSAGAGWYTLDGRRLSAKPTQRGVYINNGKKVVIK